MGENTYWDWKEFCGPADFHLWSAETHDLGVCFQELCLWVPVLALLSTTSAYYFGQQLIYLQRGQKQLLAISARCFLCVLFVLLPVLQTYAILESNAEMSVIYYLLSAVQCLAWLCHFGYNLKLRNSLCLSPRGHVFINVLWSMLLVLNIISTRSYSLIYRSGKPSDGDVSINYAFSIARLVLHLLYGLTLIPSGGSHSYSLPYPENNSETQALLANGSQFSRFREEQDPNYLGVAMDDSTWFSKLIFHWVNPLVEKGAHGQLRNVDDLFDLPDELDSNDLSWRFERALVQSPSTTGDNFFLSFLRFFL